MNELGNTLADKDYKPSGISKAEERALKAYPDVLFPFTPLDLNAYRREAFINGYEAAEKDIKELIQYKIDSIGNNRERGYWLDAASELSDIIDMIDG